MHLWRVSVCGSDVSGEDAVNHPNRGVRTARSNPTPEHIREVRMLLGLEVPEAADLIYGSITAWHSWEAGSARMHPQLWEAFLWKAKARYDATARQALDTLQSKPLHSAPSPHQ
jgi:hypothetical protein